MRVVHKGQRAILSRCSYPANQLFSPLGWIKQTKTVANNTTTEFARIKNAAGSTDKYYGVEITPNTGSMDNTVVEVKGAQTCATSGTVRAGVQRCYVVTPATDQTADVRFYSRSAEANNNNTPDVYHESGGAWTAQTTSARGGNGEVV